MKRFAVFTFYNDSANKIFIRIDHISTVHYDAKENCSLLYLSNGKRVNVKESYDDIVRAIKNQPPASSLRRMWGHLFIWEKISLAVFALSTTGYVASWLLSSYLSRA